MIMGAKHTPTQPILLVSQSSIERSQKYQENEHEYIEEFPKSITKVTLQSVNGQVDSFYIDSALTCLEFKELLYRKVSNTLEPKRMILKLNGKRISDQQILGDILTINDLIMQQRLPLWEVSQIQYFSQVEDDFTLEKGTAKTPCGHMIGRDSIIPLIKMMISDKKYQIFCPYGNCKVQWSYEWCKRIGGLTKEQDKQLMAGLEKNYVQKFSQPCPGCKALVLNEDDKMRKVKCNTKKCSYGHFCFHCLKKWNSNSQLQCGNVECEFSQAFFQKEVSTKKFNFLDPVNNINFSVDVPSTRLCPSCKTSIEHVSGCKHMKCPNCSTYFCFICLSVFVTEWKCGSFNSYCGMVAQKQKLL